MKMNLNLSKCKKAQTKGTYTKHGSKLQNIDLKGEQRQQQRKKYKKKTKR